MIIKKIFNKLFNTEEILQSSVTNIETITKLFDVNICFNTVFSHDKETALQMGTMIHNFLCSQPTIKLSDWSDSLKYLDIKKHDLAKLNIFDSEVRDSLLCIISLNHNGFVREEALLMLNPKLNNISILFVLFRLSDWVYEIKIKAEKLLLSCIDTVDTKVLIRHYKVINWLLKIKRNDQTKIHTLIMGIIFDEKNIYETLKYIQTQSDGVRFFFFKHLLDKVTLTEDMVNIILADRISVIRILVFNTLDFSNNAEIVKRALNDTAIKINKKGLDIVSTMKIEPFEKELTKLLTSESSYVREYSRELLSKIRTIDFHQFYKQLVETNCTPNAIFGLSEVGTINDIETYKTLVTSEYAKNVAASLHALSIIDYQYSKSLAFEYIQREQPCIKKICCKIISIDRDSSDLNIIRDMYSSGDDLTKYYLLKLMYRYQSWSVCGDILISMCEENPLLSNVAKNLFKTWLRKTIYKFSEILESDRKYVLDIHDNIYVKKTRNELDEIKFIFRDK